MFAANEMVFDIYRDSVMGDLWLRWRGQYMFSISQGPCWSRPSWLRDYLSPRKGDWPTAHLALRDHGSILHLAFDALEHSTT